MAIFTFKKKERLKSRKIIGRLFKEGQSFGVYPLRLAFLQIEKVESEMPVQFTVSVPKKNFRSAVVRNRIKRKVREAWRLQKHWLYERMEKIPEQYAFMIIYTGREDQPYAEIEQAVRQINNRFFKKYILSKPNQDQRSRTLS